MFAEQTNGRWDGGGTQKNKNQRGNERDLESVWKIRFEHDRDWNCLKKSERSCESYDCKETAWNGGRGETWGAADTHENKNY